MYGRKKTFIYGGVLLMIFTLACAFAKGRYIKKKVILSCSCVNYFGLQMLRLSQRSGLFKE